MDPLTVEKLESKADERLVEEEMAKFEQEMLNFKSIPIHDFAKKGNLTGVKRQVTAGVNPAKVDEGFVGLQCRCRSLKIPHPNRHGSLRERTNR